MTMILNRSTFTAALLGYTVGTLSKDPGHLIELLDDPDSPHEGNLAMVARYLIDSYMESDDIQVLDLFFDYDEMTNDDMERISHYLGDPTLIDELTEFLKKLEPTARMIYNRNHPTIDDV